MSSGLAPQMRDEEYMSLRKCIMATCFVMLTSTVVPSKASADWLFTPFLGSTYGGSANVGGPDEAFKDEFERKLNYGASLAWLGGGVMGFEVDFGYSPNFFGVSDDDSGINFVGDGNVTTLMGNLVVSAPLGGVRPYASGGVGIIASRVDNADNFFDKASSQNLGLDAGAGVMFLAGNVGLRGDIRYFRSMTDDDPDGIDLNLGNFRFWRGTVGVTFKF
jgi:hypothetical protein